MKKTKLAPNVMIGYNEKGKIAMYYWQEESFVQKNTVPFIPKLKWYEKLWLRFRFRNQKTVNFTGFKRLINNHKDL